MVTFMDTTEQVQQINIQIEELKKFQFSLEVEDAEEAINSLSREIDMADLLLKMMEKTQKEEKEKEEE